MKGKLNRFFGIIIWGLLLVGLIAFQVDMIFLSQPAKEEPAFKKGDQAPDFVLLSLEGKTYQLAELLKSAPVVLVFFSSLNAPSRIEIGELDDYLKKQKEPSFYVVLISDQSKSELLQFKKELNLSLPVLYDPKGKMMSEYKIRVLPANFLIGRDGRVIYGQYGSEGFNIYRIQALLSYPGSEAEKGGKR